MIRRFYLFAPILALALFYAGMAGAQQYPVMDRVAQKVIQKYQNSSCEELAAMKANPPQGEKAEMEQRVIQLLHQDLQTASGLY